MDKNILTPLGKIVVYVNDAPSVYDFSPYDCKTRAILENLVEALNIDMLYVCIDELWLIDQKGELSLQPLFLEYPKHRRHRLCRGSDRLSGIARHQ